MYRFVCFVAKVILHSFYRFTIVGKEKVPAQGGFVLACTHMGWLDVIALGAASPRQIHYMAKKELFSKPLIGWFLKRLNSFPVNRENPGPSSLKTPIRLTRQGNVVGIFPSGTRTHEDVPQKRGAVYIADKGKVSVVPAAYWGPESIRFKDLFRRKKMVIVFGEPLMLSEFNSKEAQTELLDELNDKMKELTETAEQL
ncbi:lysophospholipid acyltransferase family protein [Hazenella coriacea]|uniref:1-acyl-sn-glycerol-3-phosphate acyltransferase n=1 Tax=Hazenella coriacea TaxID=1179467 RepID=A0A4R3LBV8_9BACL|nr:lysophospholipid acyltransferase family protein [Hazenella coriacea]TCS95794.1 1-acyl-sn-glycerol-3-phosphate acyltransferase [Hazenella coriacea]